MREVDGQHVLSMYFFFYIFDGWSIVKLTGSMFFFDVFLRHFRWMVDREVDGPVWVVLGRSWGLCVRSWAALGAYVGGLGAVLGPMLAILSCSWASTGGPGPLLGPL